MAELSEIDRLLGPRGKEAEDDQIMLEDPPQDVPPLLNEALRICWRMAPLLGTLPDD